MKVLNDAELEKVAGGCPVCPLVPGICFGGSVIVGLAGAVSWLKQMHPAITYASAATSVALLGASAYIIYDRYVSHSAPHSEPSTALVPTQFS